MKNSLDYYRELPKPGKKCEDCPRYDEFFAHYKISGRWLCRTHAQAEIERG